MHKVGSYTLIDLEAIRRSEGLSGRPIFLFRLTYPSLVDAPLLAEHRTLEDRYKKGEVYF